MHLKKIKFINRDLSWLSFNERVLLEAEDKTVPLAERLKFLGIFSNNLDEFFRVRVASLKRMANLGKSKNLYPDPPKKILHQIQERVLELQRRFETIFHNITKQFEKNQVYFINEKQLNSKQGTLVKNYFQTKVRPCLVPIMLDSPSKILFLKEKSIYLAVKMSSLKDKNLKYALIELPTDVISRFLILPDIESSKYIILLDDIIRYCLMDIFAIFKWDNFEAYTLKITRDAELDLDTDFSKSFLEKVKKSIMLRKKGHPVRLIYDSSIPKDFLQKLLKKMDLAEGDNIVPGGRYHNFKDFINFPDLGFDEFRYTPPEPLNHADLQSPVSIFKVIKKKDILLYYPFHSYNHMIDLLREAAIDPTVSSIKITIYRVAKNSTIMNALINAIRNGKNVTVVLEIQARFDEETNIYWGNKLQDEGATVIYGVPGLKVHSKLFLITRREGDQVTQYAHIGTGNFNEATAKLYTDYSLLTADPRITTEVNKVFMFYQNNFKIGTYKNLLVSPFYLRRKLIQLINTEIQNAKEGKTAWMILKMNNLVDDELIKKLYLASIEGVKIDLIIRGICSLVPGIRGLSEHIKAISIVDKYLEHSRVFVFCNNNEEKFFISSADWMVRNLDHRSEIACPVYDKRLQKEIRDVLNIQLKDNTKARVLDKHHDNHYVKSRSDKKIRSQDAIYDYFKSKIISDK